MGILSTLLTGVSLVGKITQGLANAFDTKNEISSDDLGQVYDANISVGGADFYLSNADSPDGKFKKYLANPTDMVISATVPNISDQGGIEYLIPPKASREINMMLDGSIPPDTEMMVGPISSSDVSDELASASDTAVKINVNSLPLTGESVSIGGITLSANAKMRLLTVEAVDSVIGSITFFSGVSDKGISAEIRDVIIPEKESPGLKIGVKRNYIIPFEDLGFSAGDKLCCRIYFASALGNQNRIRKHSAQCRAMPARVLTHFENKAKLR